MAISSHPRSRYAPRGVVRKQVAMRLLPCELAKHQSLVRQAGISSSSLARKIYLRGLVSYEHDVMAMYSDGINTPFGVNRA
jgi:hypothetical protein